MSKITPINILSHVFGSSSIKSTLIKYTIGIIENPKTTIDFMECFISKVICSLETSLSLILLSRCFRSKILQTDKNKKPIPKYRNAKYPKVNPYKTV
ncbi:hypothetical protein GCM10022397_01510 [Flavivirga jejuensis]